ncbi:homeobox-leucine zipper protein PROTODERMAL FACTOR 2-like [Apium graveolens]|uniref:homeobox-leucine zipper protein PROTODERMAL FACTOR 2-like n=1 Tax=Apium graveolens TaxID=4045 RepID=UPI003D78DDBF
MNLIWQIEMAQNNAVNGIQQEAGLRGVAACAGGDPSGVAPGGGPSAIATAFPAAGGPSGIVAGAGGHRSGVAAVFGAGVDPSEFSGSVGRSAYAAGGSSGVASGGAGPATESARGKRRNHRHSQQQINAMEAYFKNNPHPNELQRNELAMSLQMDPTQVKCWFQNKRTQVKSQREIEENDALQTENDALRARKQQLIEALRKNTCPQCSVDNSRQPMERNNLRLENSQLRKEVELLKSTIVGFTSGQNLQNRPLTFQDRRNLPIISQNHQEHNPQNFSIVSPSPQNLPIASQSLPMISQNSQNLPVISETGNANTYPVDLDPAYANTSMISFRDGIQSMNVPTSHEFNKSLKELVVLAAEELKVLSMSAKPVWISSSADGATGVLNEAEYLSTFHDNFGAARLGYICEASRHIDRVLMSPSQLLNILMNVNEWAFTFSDIVSKAMTLYLPSEGMNHNAALQVMAAEYYIPTPLVPNRRAYFARYCTQHCEGVWAVVDVSVDRIRHTPERVTMTCQKRPSGCLIQRMSDGTSKITWIEHVYVDYTGVGTIYKRLLRSGLGFGAKRWVSILKRQCQLIVSANVPSSTHGFNNQVMLSPEGRRGILMLSKRMVNYFISGIISGLRSGRWTEVHGNFGDDIRLMSARAVDDPGLPSGTLLSVTTSFALSIAPNMVFNFLRDHKYRKEWDICANGIEYEPVCRISYGEEANNCISIHKVMRRGGEMLELQESWSDPVASHIVFASTENRTINAILGGGDPNGLPLMPFGFIILPDGPSSRINGSSGTLLTVSFQILMSKSPTADIDSVATAKVTKFLRCQCEKIKHALGAVGPKILN